jgi:NAD(P)-dependent dehydrogenase (short-subunit alcohol dehydrogenase family)
MNRDYSALMKTNNKVALMTGANRGLGLQTARELGKLGITLLLGVRDVSKSQEAIISILAKNCRGN